MFITDILAIVAIVVTALGILTAIKENLIQDSLNILGRLKEVETKVALGEEDSKPKKLLTKCRKCCIIVFEWLYYYKERTWKRIE